MHVCIGHLAGFKEHVKHSCRDGCPPTKETSVHMPLYTEGLSKGGKEP